MTAPARFPSDAGDGPPPAGVDDAFAALADPVRRRVVELLAERPYRAGELAAAIGTSPSTLSKHLRVLRTRGLVQETHPEFDARVRIFHLRSAPMVELRNWLALAERGWTEQLTAFARHLAEDGQGAGPDADGTGVDP
ncbi:metalloregulator ArsR/SmtB family transcription factor [Tsukamurella soli]|uniref:ArsR/SmtB family transcription factor n=1 Tax=Tsukamurella soli TaxID=644556 RepID=UPI0031E78EF3